MRIRDFQSGPEVAWLISDRPLWPRVQFVGRTVGRDCDRLEKYPVSVLPNFLKTADFPLFKLSIHSKRISTNWKIPGKFFSGSVSREVAVDVWEVSRQYNTLSLLTAIINPHCRSAAVSHVQQHFTESCCFYQLSRNNRMRIGSCFYILFLSLPLSESKAELPRWGRFSLSLIRGGDKSQGRPDCTVRSRQGGGIFLSSKY